ncbi:dTDP-glucose 4,6-dehydratase [archaeon HR01]|nr:dTDP-glucose 4,6-dehydratase [archaeon HR01]
MRVVVTGGAGFIGSRLVARLAELGDEVTVIDDLSKGRIENLKKLLDSHHVRLHILDITEREKISERLDDSEALVHLAAISSVTEAETQPARAFRVNVMGTEFILESCIRKKVRKAIFASSAAVFGDGGRPFTEKDPPNPQNVYGATKVLGERLFESYAYRHGLHSVVLRIFNVYGGGMAGQGVVDRFITACLSGKPLEIYGDGLQMRDFIHVDDVVEAFIKSLDFEPSENFARFNIGSGQPLTIAELAGMILRMFGASDHMLIHREARPGDIRFSVADISQARTVLGFEPRIRVKDWVKKVAMEMRS